MNDHDRLGEWSAAYVLGALDSEDRRLFERHLDSCDLCAADVASFAPIPGLLSKVDVGERERIASGSLTDDGSTSAGPWSPAAQDGDGLRRPPSWCWPPSCSVVWRAPGMSPRWRSNRSGA